MRILLVNANIISPMIFPVGMEYAAEMLISWGHQVTICDMNVHKDIDAALPHQDLVLIGVRNIDSAAKVEEFYLPHFRRLIQHLREVFAGPVAIAGAAVNLHPYAIRTYLGADFALASKGFGALQVLVSGLENGIPISREIVDFATSVSGRFKRNIVDKSAYETTRIGVVTKSGCPYRCMYCDYPVIDGSQMALRPPEEVVDEIESLQAQGVRRIFFCDSNFNVPERHAHAILRLLHKRDIGLDWDGFTNPHPAAFTRDYATLAKALGKRRMHLGVDSLSDEILHSIGKPFTVGDVRTAVGICQDLGLGVGCSLLFGHPAETIETVDETFRNLDTLGLDYVDISPQVRVYPATPLSVNLRSRHIIEESQDLIEPFFYPVQPQIRDRILEHSARREVCRSQGLCQYL